MPPDPKLVERLIAKLDSDDFEQRNGATEELGRLGDVAVPALQKTLTGKTALETRRRVEALLVRLTAQQAPVVRAVEVLERAGTPDAQQALQALANGAPGRWWHARRKRDSIGCVNGPGDYGSSGSWR